MIDSNFERALQYVLKNEGGPTNDPLDPGGATKFGITRGALSRYRGKSCSVDDVFNLERSDAAVIYALSYWHVLSCHHMDSLPIATAIFDAGVLFGVDTADVAAQRALVDHGYELEVDGHIGPKTLAALNSIDPAKFLAAYRLRLQQRISEIVLRRPQSIRFEKGWENRVAKFSTLV